MIQEIALLTIDPLRAEAFEAAVAKAAPLFRAAEGCHGMELQRGVEHPERYRLIVRWRTVDDHMVGFRQSAAFDGWRALAGPFFIAPPEVEHVAAVASYF